MRVYFAGAFSEGKTTLKKRVSQVYGLKSIPEQIRLISVENEPNLSLEKVRSHTPDVDQLQIDTLKRQYDTELSYKDNFVSCRCIDNVAFLSFFGTKGMLWEVRQSPTYKNYVEWLRDRSVTIFYVLPHRKLISNDGFRDTDWELALQISGAVRMVLDLEGLNYIPVHPLVAADREKIIFNYLDAVKSNFVGPIDNKEGLTSFEIEMATKGDKIAAIKAVRARTSLGLRESKDLVDSFIKRIVEMGHGTQDRPHRTA